MAPNRKSQSPARNGRRATGRGLDAAASSARSSRRTPRVPLGLRASLSQYARKSLRSGRGAGVRATGSFPRVLRLPRLRAVAPGCWPCAQAQRLVPVSWCNDRWTPLVRVRRARARRLPRLRLQVTFKYPQSLTTL
jgi:hypothetical protein